MLENKYEFEGISYAKFAISWRMACDARKVRGYSNDMIGWLESLTINGKKMDNGTIFAIVDYAFKDEPDLTMSAFKYLKK